MTARPAQRTELPYENGGLRDGAGQDLRPGGPRLTAQAIARAAWRPGETVIDIGCGGGCTLDHLRRNHLTAIGIDLAENALCLAQRRDSSFLLVQGSGESLPFADASVDGVMAECSLSLMPDQGRMLAEAHRVLRPGGRLVITDVYARNPVAPDRCDLALPECLAGILERDGLCRRLERAGFSIETWEDHSDLLKLFVARFIFEHGSLDSLWGGTAACSAATWSALRPGYALAIANKTKFEPRKEDHHG
jgi:SAM-dependent methyltransferase